MPCQLGITSMSLGWSAAGHQLEHKLELAHQYGYKGIELFWDDLRDLALRKFKQTADDYKLSDPSAEPSHTAQVMAAHHIRQICQHLDIFIICLQPFAGYEGLKDLVAKQKLMDKLHRWFELAHILNTDMIQIPSSFAPAEHMSEDLSVIVQDFQVLADLGAQQSPPLRFVHEALCFGTRVNLWETSWDVVKRVDRDNFGLCLDSFNIAGRIYADPASPTCKTLDADEAVRRSLELMVKDLDMSKVFYVQIVDAERLTTPLNTQTFYDAGLVPRMNWSRNCRLFYGEEDRGGFLPIREIAETFFNKLGFQGWVSLELFNRRMGDKDKEVPEELARRGAISWAKLVHDLKLDVVPLPSSVSVEESLVGEESSVADEASSPEGDESSESSEDPTSPKHTASQSSVY